MTAGCCASFRNGTSDVAPDLAIIGAGSAGFAAAIRAAELGARVALIGHGMIGGTCVNVGCIPSKTLIRAAETLHQARTASRFAGVWADSKLVDWQAVIAQKDELVYTLRELKYVELLREYENVSYVEGGARLTHDGVSVNGSLMSPRKIVITTGASPAIPTIPGLETIPWLTSATALELTNLPASLLVIGGGSVGCELGQLFARAGVQVTIICRSRLLPRAEPEISEALATYLRDEGIDVRCGVEYRRIGNKAGGVVLELRRRDGALETAAAQRVLVATGRQPNTFDLDLDQVGVKLTHNGGIEVDDRMRTTREGTYAAGDVTGRHMFVYMAAYGAKVAAENALNGDSRRYETTAIPEVVFTDPQVATVGLTEAQAIARGLDAQAVTLPLDQVPRALSARDTRGLIKIVADRQSGRLLGASIIAPEGGDSIQTATLAIKHKLTVSDLTETIFPYLTTVEGLKLAALGFTKDISKLSCCAG